MAVFIVSLRRYVEMTTDIRVVATDPTDAGELAKAEAELTPTTWDMDDTRVVVQSISVKCEHPKAQCSPDPDGSGFECHVCKGHNWIDVEVPA